MQNTNGNNEAKITFSTKELELMNNIDWILTKQQIINKIVGLFATQSEQMQVLLLEWKELLPEVATMVPPKISKGENYQQLPYVMLDYPRYFTQKDTIAIRTFFWWGDGINMHLLIKGQYQPLVVKSIMAQIQLLHQQQFYICIYQNEWQHHFNEDNYLTIQQMDESKLLQILQSKSFIKIAKKIPLKEWDGVDIFLKETFLTLINLIKLST
jgi:hypothetical protein